MHNQKADIEPNEREWQQRSRVDSSFQLLYLAQPKSALSSFFVIDFWSFSTHTVLKFHIHNTVITRDFIKYFNFGWLNHSCMCIKMCVCVSV
jgi:hypothetical protein